MNDEYEVDDLVCPECGHSPVHSRRCAELGCEDGYVDRYDEDPGWYDKNNPEMCSECYGTGLERWCPKCGTNLQRPDIRKKINFEAHE